MKTIGIKVSLRLIAQVCGTPWNDIVLRAIYYLIAQALSRYAVLRHADDRETITGFVNYTGQISTQLSTDELLVTAVITSSLRTMLCLSTDLRTFVDYVI